MQRYFLKTDFDDTLEKITVTGEPVHHMKNVMRMAPSDKAFLVFNNGESVLAEVIQVNDDSLDYKILDKHLASHELPIAITIASGFPKGDKLELIVQKGTELGAHAFLAFPSDWAVAKWDDKKRKKKQQRLEKIAEEAAEQSHRTHAPSVDLLASEKQLLDKFTDYDFIVVAYEESAKEGELGNLVKTFEATKYGQKLLFLFGPEGGFSPKEIETFTQAGAVAAGLGPRIMRAETAPFYVLATASYAFELKK
jgi:16S rRNA (uracil1498-N3)-methyltransferase